MAYWGKYILMLVAGCCLTANAASVSHPFLCADIHKNQVVKVNSAGEVTWSYAAEYVHDLWQLSNGNILFSGPNTGAQEITPDKKIVWEYPIKKGEKIFGCQPLPNGDVLVSIGGKPNKLIEVKRDGTISKTIKLKAKKKIRLARKTKGGNYLVAARSEKSFHVYDPSGKLLRKQAVPGGAFLAVELENGNVLTSCGDGHSIVEIDPDGNTVWQIAENDIAGIPLRFVAGIQRLPNGDTVVVNWGGHGHIGKQVQIFEVTPEKNVVWQINDNQQFSTPVHVQILDVPGDPTKYELYR